MAATPTAVPLPAFDLPPPRASALARLARWGGVALLHGMLLYGVVGTALPRDEARPPRTVSVRLLPLQDSRQPDPRPVAAARAAAPVTARPRPLPVPAASSAGMAAPVTAAPRETAPLPAAPAVPAAPVADAAPAVTAARFDADYLQNPRPVYPAFSRRAGEQGRVLLKVTVSAEGVALAVEIEQSSGFARLDTAAREAVRSWRFIPARRGNEAIETRVTVPLTFRIE